MTSEPVDGWAGRADAADDDGPVADPTARSWRVGTSAPSGRPDAGADLAGDRAGDRAGDTAAGTGADTTVDTTVDAAAVGAADTSADLEAGTARASEPGADDPVGEDALPATGTTEVDAALTPLAQLPGLPVGQHPDRFDRVAADLHEVLADAAPAGDGR